MSVGPLSITSFPCFSLCISQKWDTDIRLQAESAALAEEHINDLREQRERLRCERERLSAENQLSAYMHKGFWQTMDTVRDTIILKAFGIAGERRGASGSKPQLLERTSRPDHGAYWIQGGWLALWLHSMQADVFGFSLPPPSEPSYFNVAYIAG